MLKDARKVFQQLPEFQMVPLCIQSKQPGTKRARVNCVDINSREVLESFLFEILADKPQVDRSAKKPFVTTRGVEKLFKLEFPEHRDAFKLTKPTTFSVVSNNPQLLAVPY